MNVTVELAPDVYDRVVGMAKKMDASPGEVIGKALSLLELALEAGDTGQYLTLTDAASGATKRRVILKK